MYIKSSTPARISFCLAGFIAFSAFGFHLQAQTTPKKVPAAPAKPAAAPAKPAPASKPAASGAASTAGHSTGGTTTTTSGHTGPTTATAGHTGPTTSNPSGGSGKITTSSASGGARTTTAGSGAAASRANASTPARAPGASGASAGSRPVPRNSSEKIASNGATVRSRPGGKISDVHDPKRGMDVHHGLDGSRRISVERADHSRVFAERGGRGYVQHPYYYHGHEFGHRTYYYNGRYYDRYYGRAYYGGVYLDVYAPGYYYAPAFYGWAYNPWAAPIAYSWGFAANPWYGYYPAGYFTPYPVYPSAAFWLTDYLVSQSLAAAYQAQIDANTPPPPLQGAAPLTDDVKKMISDEVQRQVALENAEAAQNAQKADVDSTGSSIARMLSDNQPHVFIAGSNLDLVDTSGTECAVSQGDVLEVASAPPANATAATALVLTTKGGKECAKAANVQVAFTDLQDMQNHMRETVDAGLSDLQKKQGQGGLPQAPPSAQGAPVQSNFAAAAPPPDSNVASEINQETQEADKAEQEAGNAVASGPSDSPSAPADTPSKTLNIGDSIEAVTSSFGQPKTILKPKVGVQIYVYPDMKVTFKGGKVSNIE